MKRPNPRTVMAALMKNQDEGNLPFLRELFLELNWWSRPAIRYFDRWALKLGAVRQYRLVKKADHEERRKFRKVAVQDSVVAAIVTSRRAVMAKGPFTYDTGEVQPLPVFERIVKPIVVIPIAADARITVVTTTVATPPKTNRAERRRLAGITRTEG